MTRIAAHRDKLEQLNRDDPLQQSLPSMHRILRERLHYIDRIAVAIYDAADDQLRTYVHSNNADNPLSHYRCALSDAPELRKIIAHGRPRIIDDLALFGTGRHEHTRLIFGHGYRSSYTMPIYSHGAPFGFVFFNSYQASPFTDADLEHLDVFGHLISLILVSEINSARILVAAIKTARRLTDSRDCETGGHLDRMARYARLIATALADSHGFTDDYIEHLFLFAPLHDIGKISVPERILHKPGRLTREEFGIMKQHAQQGRDIIDEMLANFDLQRLQHVDMLRNIPHYHHEAMDGSGYPAGLEGRSIPIEARIVAVSDVFDALASRRPYKPPWPNARAFARLRELAGPVLDPDCVDALIRNREAVENIQASFKNHDAA